MPSPFILPHLHGWHSTFVCVAYRYPTKELLIRCLEQLWESAGIGDGEQCSKIFVGKPSGSTAGVEGLFGTDGVLYALVFQIARESAADAVDIIGHRQVRNWSSKYCHDQIPQMVARM